MDICDKIFIKCRKFNEELYYFKHTIDLIISGSEAKDGTSFIMYRTILLDAWNKEDGYKKYYKDGSFESLPLEMKNNFHRINNVVEV